MPERLRDRIPPAWDELVVRVGVSAYTGWETLRVERVLDACCGAFALRYADPRPLFLGPGSRISVHVGFQHELGDVEAELQVLDGRVDSIRTQDSADGTTTEVAGRDLTADLVDCSVVHGSEWRDLDLVELVRALVEPWGIEVVEGPLKTVGPRFPIFRVQPGETAWQAIERACRLRSLLCYGNESGQLVIEGAGPRHADADLVWGENVLVARVEYTHAQRYRTYTVRGQGGGAALDFGVAVAQPEGLATDPEVQRYRPLLVLAEGPVSVENAEDRAAWEATVRAARSARVLVTVRGWRQWSEGVLWRVNELVRVVIPHRRIDTLMLIAAVRLVRDAQGTRTELELVREDAYSPARDLDQGLSPFEEMLETVEYGDDGGEL